jgi:isopentenyl-diphosphate delta-isomerase
MKTRENRKHDHIKYALALADGPLSNGFSQVHVLPNCLPEIAREDVNLSTSLPGIPKLAHPLIINAMTGGTDEAEEINKQLAKVALNTQSAMAVGSQYGAIKTNNNLTSFTVVRKENPQGIIFANVSPLASVSEGQQAVDMLEAQALQVHLNVAQELAMEEGDRNFTGFLKRIEQLAGKITVPIIVKETGAGMAATQIKALTNVGVNIIDVGGAGGTNFMAIEAARFKETNQELCGWGLPTAISLLEAKGVLTKQQGLIATGGLRTGLDILKALVLGANAVGMAGNILKFLVDGGVDNATAEINSLLHNLKDFMVLTGSKTVPQLTQVPVYYTGEVYEALRTLNK